MREARENHDAAVQQILDQAVQADELLSSMKRNYEEAEAVTRHETGWTSIFSAAKAFIAYLARWLS
jgi:precorrin-4 methylase